MKKLISLFIVMLLLMAFIPTEVFASQSTVVLFSKKADGNTKLSANFKVSEFASKDGSDEVYIDMELIAILQNIRDHFGKAVTINSGYRTPAHNKKVGGATNSYHIKGMAADIVVSGVKPAEVAKYAESIGVRGVGKYTTFVHVDTRPTKYYWDNTSGSQKTVKTHGGTYKQNPYVFDPDDYTPLNKESTLKINLTSYPKNITKGNSFNLVGTISSNYKISSVTGYILDASGNEVQKVTVKPSAYTLDIKSSNINYSLKFGELKNGLYTLKITAKDTKKTVSWNKDFIVGSSTYTVSFDSSGGGVVSAKTVNLGATYGDLPNPARDNYTFTGWYTAKSGGEKVSDSTKVITAKNHTLYARWEADEIMLVTEVMINTLPERLSYSIGEELDLTGLSIKVVYSDGSSIILDTGYDVTSYDPSVAGFQQVSVSFMGISAEFEVEVFGNVLFILGDVNLDGKVNALDATQILRYSNNKSSILTGEDEYEADLAKFAADVNADDKINALDATQILRYANNKSSALKK